MKARRRPATVEELIRDLDDRLRVLEHRPVTVVGSPPAAWVVEVDAAGQLTARHAASGSVTVIAAP